MSVEPSRYEVVSVSLPRPLVKRANRLIPRAKRSRVVRELLAMYLDSLERRELERAYAAYYAKRSPAEQREEQQVLQEWALADEEAWRLLEEEEKPRGRRKAR
jgi:metal-responsive CopG/Arc/MetJ family transcriptional regulator